MVEKKHRRTGEEAGNLRKVIRACIASERQITQEGRKSVKLSAGSRTKRGVGCGMGQVHRGCSCRVRNQTWV